MPDLEPSTEHGARGTITRAPNHLGDLVLALPALAAVRGDVMVRRSLAPLVRLAGVASDVLELDRGAAGFVRAVRQLQRRRYHRGVLLTPSFGSALQFVLGRIPERRGTPSDRRGPLLTERVGTGSAHRTMLYLDLVGGEPPEAGQATPRLSVPEAQRARWRELAGDRDEVTIGICPGSRASSRRWPAERFREVVRSLADQGYRVAVFGERGERKLTRLVAGGVALDCGGRSDLLLLAAGLAACRLVVANDSGPLHLAAAVGTPAVSLWGAGDPRETGIPGGPERHIMLRRSDLPCVPCARNVCPRRGGGTILPSADRECLTLISVADVLGAVRRSLAAA